LEEAVSIQLHTLAWLGEHTPGQVPVFTRVLRIASRKGLDDIYCQFSHWVPAELLMHFKGLAGALVVVVAGFGFVAPH